MENKSSTQAHAVKLRIYDLSRGQAKHLAKSLLGIELEGIWHTSVEVYGYEYYFANGIMTAYPGSTSHSEPLQTIDYKTTAIPQELFAAYLKDLENQYNFNSYNLFKNNCNHFSNDLMLFLVGSEIPKHILNLSEEVMEAPLFGTFMNFLKGNENNGGFSQ